MATIQANVHKNLVEFLKDFETHVKAKQYFDTLTLNRAFVPSRAWSSFPVRDMVSVAAKPAHPVATAGAKSLYSAKLTPKTFGQFLLDLQDAIDGGKTIGTVTWSRPRLKPYCAIDVIWGTGTVTPTNPLAWVAHPAKGTVGVDVVLTWKDGTAPYGVIVTKPDGTEHDNKSPSAATTYTLTNTADAGDWTVDVTDAAGVKITQKVTLAAAPAAKKTLTGKSNVAGAAGADVAPTALFTASNGGSLADIAGATVTPAGKGTWDDTKGLTIDASAVANDVITVTLKAITGYDLTPATVKVA